LQRIVQRSVTGSRVNSAPTVPEKTSLAPRLYLAFLTLVWLTVAGGALLKGLPYYLTPLAQRPFSDLYEAFRPAGRIGHGFGVLGTLMMMVGVATYSLRKRMPALQRLGRLKYWLQFHIFLCTLGPFFVLLHTSFKFGGIVSIAFWSMVVVVASGVFGRYVYARIPKGLQGRFTSLDALEQQAKAQLDAIGARTPLAEDLVRRLAEEERRVTHRGYLSALGSALVWDLARRRRRRRIGSLLAESGVPAETRGRLISLIEEHRQLRHQMAVLGPFQKLFCYWHIFHLPLAIVLLVVLVLHVAVVTMFGYGLVR